MYKNKKSAIILSICTVLEFFTPFIEKPFILAIFSCTMIIIIMCINQSYEGEIRLFLVYRSKRYLAYIVLIGLAISPFIKFDAGTVTINISNPLFFPYMLVGLFTGMLFNYAIQLPEEYLLELPLGFMNLPNAISYFIVSMYRYFTIRQTISPPLASSIENSVMNYIFLLVTIDTIIRALIHISIHAKHLKIKQPY